LAELVAALSLGTDLGSVNRTCFASAWPGNLRGEAVQIGARIAAVAEFTEVAHRVGGIPARDQSSS